MREPPAPGERLVWIVLALSVAIKLAAFTAVHAAGPDRIVTGDTPAYERPAIAILHTARFAHDRTTPDTPETLVPPGYSVFIAAVYLAAGEHRSAVVVAQIALSTLTVWLTFAFARRLWGADAARIALAVLACDLLSFVYSQLLFAETLFTLLVAYAAWSAVRLQQTGRLSAAGAFGGSLALATLVRPITYYLFGPALVLLLVAGRLAGWKARHLVAVALVAAMPWVVLVEGWRLRNYEATGRAELSDIKAINLLWYRAAGVVAARDGVSFWEARERIQRDLPAAAGLSPGQLNALYEREAVRIILAHPWLLARVEAYGIAKIVAGSGRADLRHYLGGVPYDYTPAGAVTLTFAEAWGRWQGEPWIVAPLAYVALHLLVLYTGVWRGLTVAWRTERPRWPVHALLAGIAMYLVVIGAGPEAYSRFRVPVMPFLAMYAGLGWSAWRGRR